MFCTQCGNNLNDKDRFCPQCGQPTGVGAPWPGRPRPPACCVELLWVVMYHPAATTIATPTPIPRRVLSLVIY